MDKLETLLQTMSASLAEVCQGTEEDFLSVGNAIQEISEDSQRNAVLANSVLESIECGDTYEIGILKSLFDDASGEIQESINLFTHLLPQIKQMTSSSQNIWNLQRSEHLLSISMSSALRKIQVSQIYGNRQTEHIIREVKLLATRINAAKHQMNEFTQLANQNYIQANQILQEIGAYNLKLERNQQQSFSHLEELHEVLEQSKNCCYQIQSDSNRISKELSPLVTVLQYHDITQQQILHIHQSLGQIASQLLPEKTDANSSSGNEKGLQQALEIQTAQLSHALWNTRSVDKSIKAQLEQVCALSRSQSSAANEILREEHLNLESLQALRQELHQLVELIHEHENMALSMMEMFAVLEIRLDALESQLDALDNLGVKLNTLKEQCLSLQNKPKTPEEESLLHLLKEKIKELSDKSESILNTDVISLKEMLKKIQNFQEENAAPLKQKLKMIQKTQRRFSKYVNILIESFVERSNTVITSVTQVSQKTNELEHSILELIPRLSFARTIETVLAPMKTQLSEILVAYSQKQEFLFFSYALDLQNMPLPYTSMQQHSIHQFCLDQGLSLTLCKIEEGWEVTQKILSQTEAAPFEDEFGDSIELF